MLSLIGLVAVIVVTIQVYKTARTTGRNAGLWAFLAFATGIGLQFVLPLAMAAIIAMYYFMTGTPLDKLELVVRGPASIVGLLGVVLSIVGMVLVTKHVSKVVDDDSSAQMPAPPPPPVFDRNS